MMLIQTAHLHFIFLRAILEVRFILLFFSGVSQIDIQSSKNATGKRFFISRILIFFFAA